MAQRRALPHSLHSFMTTVCLDGNSACSTISLSLIFMLGTKTSQNKPTLHWSYSEKCTPTLTTVCLSTDIFAGGVIHSAATGN